MRDMRRPQDVPAGNDNRVELLAGELEEYAARVEALRLLAVLRRFLTVCGQRSVQLFAEIDAGTCRCGRYVPAAERQSVLGRTACLECALRESVKRNEQEG